MQYQLHILIVPAKETQLPRKLIRGKFCCTDDDIHFLHHPEFALRARGFPMDNAINVGVENDRFINCHREDAAYTFDQRRRAALEEVDNATFS